MSVVLFHGKLVISDSQGSLTHSIETADDSGSSAQ